MYRMDPVHEEFDAGGSEYDARRKWIIATSDDFCDAAIRTPEQEGERPAILDIGAALLPGGYGVWEPVIYGNEGRKRMNLRS